MKRARHDTHKRTNKHKPPNCHKMHKKGDEPGGPPLRLAYININKLSQTKTNEINMWLSQQHSVRAPVHALLLTEPVIKGEDMQFDPRYELTEATAQHEENLNPHLDTRALFLNNDPLITITNHTQDIKPLHTGITWLKIHAVIQGAQHQPEDLFVASVYIPNKNKTNKEEYITSIYNTLKEHTIQLGNHPTIIFMDPDSNCPHDAPRSPSTGRNKKPLYEFLEETNMQVLNWTSKLKTGFHTRFRKGQRSQLDLSLANKAALAHVRDMHIRRKVNFMSDHVLLDVTLSTQRRSAIKQAPTTRTDYYWEECHRPVYEDELKSPLKQWTEETHAWTKQLEAETPQQKDSRRGTTAQATTIKKALSTRVKLLESEILAAYKRAVPHREITSTPENTGQQKIDKQLAVLINERESQREVLEDLAYNNAADPKIKEAETELAKLSNRVRARFHQLQEDNISPQIEQLEKARREKSEDYYTILEKLTRPPKTQLPRTLIRDGREIRQKKSILEEWIKRYNLKTMNLGNSACHSKRAEIEKENAKRRKNREYEPETGKADWCLIDRFSQIELRRALKRLKPHKSPSDDGITNEMVKRGG